MSRIKDLYAAIVRPEKPEDKCTNFLIWLLEKSPPDVINEICQKADLSFRASEIIDVSAQYKFAYSRPDALIDTDGKYLVIETKLYPKMFDKAQFQNHMKGAGRDFGIPNAWFLFLSGDSSTPQDLSSLKKKYSERIGFISWKSLLHLINEKIPKLPEKYQVLANEFIRLANHYKLGRLTSMNTKELAEFIGAYPIVEQNRDTAQEMFNNFMGVLKKRIVTHCNERVEIAYDDVENELPCLYAGLKIENWHTTPGAYIFLNIYKKKLGILLIGHEFDKKAKKNFNAIWNSKFKNTFKTDDRLCSFIWEEDDDSVISNKGYFKLIDWTSGKMFDPEKLQDFTDSFYWGYQYDFDVNVLDSYYKTIPDDFLKLIDSFSVEKQSPGKPKSQKGKPKK